MVRERLLPDDDSRTHYAPGSEIDRATFWAHSTQGALWPLSRELPRWDESTPYTRSISKTPSMPRLRWPASELPHRANLHSGFSCFRRFKNLPLTIPPTWGNCHARKTHSQWTHTELHIARAYVKLLCIAEDTRLSDKNSASISEVSAGVWPPRGVRKIEVGLIRGAVVKARS